MSEEGIGVEHGKTSNDDLRSCMDPHKAETLWQSRAPKWHMVAPY